MDRRSVLQSIFAVVAVEGCAQTVKTETQKGSVFVAGGEDRFRDETVFPRCKLSGKDTNGALCVVGGDHNNLFNAAVPLHVHHNQDEFWYIVDGEFLFQVGDRKIRAKAGDSLFGPRGVPHSPRQISKAGSLLSVLQPAGTIEEFFRELAKILRKEGGMPSPEQMAQLFRAHGMEIVGPVVEL